MIDYQWLYNSTQMVPDKQRIFTVGSNPIQVSGAGLTQCVDIYIAVGDCVNCGPGDVLWAPLAFCGEVVQLCPDNNVLYFTVPGKYSFGDPNAALVLPGDVNVRRTELTGLSNEQIAALSKKCSGPQDVNIVGPLPLPVDDAAGNVLLTSILASLNTIAAKKDYEYKSVVVCDLTTDTWHQLTTSIIDGVEGATIDVDLGRPCSEPRPIPSDIEPIDYCDPGTKTIHTKIVRFDFPNPADPTIVVEVVMSDTDTGIACEPITKTSLLAIEVCAAGVTLTQKTVLSSDGNENISFWGPDGIAVAAPPKFTVGRCLDLEVVGCLPLASASTVKLSILNKWDPAEMTNSGAPWDQFKFIGNIDSSAPKHGGWFVYELCGDASLVGTTDGNGFAIQLGTWTVNPDLSGGETIAAPNAGPVCPAGGKQKVKIIQRDDGLGGKFIAKVYSIDAAGALVEHTDLTGLTIGECSKSSFETGAARFVGPMTVDAALLLTTAPAGASLTAVDILVRLGAPTILGSLAVPASGSTVVSPAIYEQSWSSRNGLNLANFTYTLSVGDEVDVFWTIET